MATIVVLLYAVVVLADESREEVVQSYSAGRPTCTHPDEFMRLWRNNWDPTRYWDCNQRDEVGAGSIVCTNGMLFSDSHQMCVKAEEWRWSGLFDPPTLAL